MKLATKVGWWCLLVLILLLFISTLEYLNLKFDTLFLRFKGGADDSLVWKSSYLIHIFGGLFCLLSGVLQFNGSLRKTKPNLHRKLGLIYLITCYTTAISGIIISMYSLGTLSSRIAFNIGFILLPAFATYAFVQIKNLQFEAHINAMTRSFAQACSILPFRIYVGVLSFGMHMPFKNAFNISTWPAFFTVVILAEIIVSRKLIKI